MATVSALRRYIGDDWTISVVVQDGNGTPIDLTGATLSALFFQGSVAAPLDVSGPNGSVTVTDAPNGAVTIVVAQQATAGATDQGKSLFYPNRVQLISTVAGRRHTLGIILIAPVAP